MKNRLLIGLLFILPLALVACNRGRTQVERNPEGGVDVTFTLTEAEVNTAIQEVLAAQPNPLLRNPTVDLQSGQIIINGEHDRRDGSGTVTGSLTMTLTVQEGVLLAQVTGADIEGFDLSDERVADFNQRLSNDFAIRAGRQNPVITMQSVTITDDQIQIVFTAQRQ